MLCEGKEGSEGEGLMRGLLSSSILCSLAVVTCYSVTAHLLSTPYPSLAVPRPQRSTNRGGGKAPLARFRCFCVPLRVTQMSPTEWGMVNVWG